MFLAAPTLLAMAAQRLPCPFPYLPLPYGCYCGITLNSPGVGPIDDIDALCQIHDNCYGKVEEDVAECKGAINEYLAPYEWELKQSEVIRTLKLDSQTKNLLALV